MGNELSIDVTKGLSVESIKGQVMAVQQLLKGVMKEGTHYGKIPGVPKPTLFKAGAEKIALMFQIRPEYVMEEVDGKAGHKVYKCKCELYPMNNGQKIGEGIGLCSTAETKFRYNRQKQERYVVDNYNSCYKMAKKRAFVDAITTISAVSDIFTQDIEDMDFESVMHEDKAPPVDMGEAKVVDKPSVKEEPKAEKEKPDTLLGVIMNANANLHNGLSAIGKAVAGHRIKPLHEKYGKERENLEKQKAINHILGRIPASIEQIESYDTDGFSDGSRAELATMLAKMRSMPPHDVAKALDGIEFTGDLISAETIVLMQGALGL